MLFNVLDYETFKESAVFKTAASSPLPILYASCDGGYISKTQSGLDTNVVTGCAVLASDTDGIPTLLSASCFAIHPRTFTDEVPGNGSSNYGELLAFYITLDRICEAMASKRGYVFVIGDSAYVLNSLSFLEKWQQSGWITSAGTHVQHQQLWVAILQRLLNFLEMGIHICPVKVKGHSGVFLNETADEICMAVGMYECKDNGTVLDEKAARSKAFFKHDLADLATYMKSRFNLNEDTFTLIANINVALQTFSV